MAKAGAGGAVLEIINARLPLADERHYYTLRAENGVWTAIGRQSGRLEPGGYISLDMPEGAYAKRLDAEGKLVLPGLVDAHMHLDKAFSLPWAANRSGTLAEAIASYSRQAPLFAKDEIKARMTRMALQAVSYGTTAIRTHIDVHAEAGARVALRSVEAALEVKEKLAPWVRVQIFPMAPYRAQPGFGMELIGEMLAMGVDGIGGAPHLADEPEAHIDRIFELADRYGCPVDLHVDESDDPVMRTCVYIAERTAAYGMGGRVVAGHLCSLSAMNPEDAAYAIGRLAESGVAAVTLPAANLYLQGRADRRAVRRGVTRVKELAAAGVPVAAASDNVHDPFHPFGRGDLLQIALIAAYAAHMGAPSDLRQLLRMITEIPAGIIGISGYGIKAGCEADFVVIDARSPEELFAMQPERRWVYRAGSCLAAAAPPAAWADPALADEWAAARNVGFAGVLAER